MFNGRRDRGKMRMRVNELSTFVRSTIRNMPKNNTKGVKRSLDTLLTLNDDDVFVEASSRVSVSVTKITF